MKNIKSLIKIAPLFASAVLLTLVFSCDTDETQEVTTKSNLVMSDEFDVNGAPDATLWNFDIGTGVDGWGNNELQYYTDRPENVTVQNGFLVITAKEESFETSSYTSARINTRNLFETQYGRFEARIQLPTGKGLWPAFWLLGASCDEDDASSVIWPQCGEIDIMEYLGDSPTVAFGSVHGPGYSGGNSISKELELENDRFDTGFHVFGIEWSPNAINYYVDDKLYQTITRADVDEETNGAGQWVFDNPFYIIMNVAVGGNLPGSPNADTIFPQRMLVDYVRVYE